VVPAQTRFGALATEANEGNPLLLAKLYESGLLADATPVEIVGILGCFNVEREAFEKSTHPNALPSTISDRVKSTLLVVDTWAQQGIAIDARHGVDSPPTYWTLSTLWVEIGTDWFNGATAGELCRKYEIYEGNLMRGLLKLANQLNEWINMATYAGDVHMLDRLRDAPSVLQRDIAQPESLYLRL